VAWEGRRVRSPSGMTSKKTSNSNGNSNCKGSGKNGVSSYEIGRALGVTQKTAWFLLHRIRTAMTDTAARARQAQTLALAGFTPFGRRLRQVF
jgi:hypothetical protein